MSLPMPSSSSSETPQQKVEKFETFINDVLKVTLKKVFEALETVNEELMDLERQENTIKTMSRLAGELPDGKPFKTRINVGCDFFMQANMDVQKFLVCIGMGYYVEFTKDEALKYIRFRIKKLTDLTNDLRDKGARVRSQITVALHCLQEVQGL